MPINVNIFIEPSKEVAVHIGDVIEFRAASSSQEWEWESSNSKGISIDRTTGRAVALAEGEHSIKYGSMETKVLINRIVDIVKGSSEFRYEPIYSDQKKLSSHPSIKSNLKWQC